MQSGSETEIKLVATPAMLVALRDHADLAGPETVSSLNTAYFDTPMGELGAAGATLRVRKGGKRGRADPEARTGRWNDHPPGRVECAASGRSARPVTVPGKSAGGIACVTEGKRARTGGLFAHRADATPCPVWQVGDRGCFRHRHDRGRFEPRSDLRTRTGTRRRQPRGSPRAGIPAARGTGSSTGRHGARRSRPSRWRPVRRSEPSTRRRRTSPRAATPPGDSVRLRGTASATSLAITGW